jgi:hypothetical protein
VTLSGTPRDGARLTAAVRGFAGQDVAYASRWERCDATGAACAAIAGAAGRFYVPAPGDVGWRLRVVFTATDRGGATDVASAPTEPIAPRRAARAPAPSFPPNPLARRGHVANGTHASEGAVVDGWFETARGRRHSTTVAAGSRVRIRGTVAAPDGAPIAGAALVGLERVAGGTWQLITGVRTRANGRFTTFSRIGPARRLRFAYYAFGDSPHARFTPTLTLAVRSGRSRHRARRRMTRTPRTQPTAHGARRSR